MRSSKCFKMVPHFCGDFYFEVKCFERHFRFLAGGILVPWPSRALRVLSRMTGCSVETRKSAPGASKVSADFQPSPAHSLPITSRNRFYKALVVTSVTIPNPPPMSCHGGPQTLKVLKKCSKLTPRWIPSVYLRSFPKSSRRLPTITKNNPTKVPDMSTNEQRMS